MLDWTDAQLVSSLQRREVEAVGVLLEQYADRLYTYAFYRCGDHHLAEDIVSDTFTRVIEKIDGYEQREVPFRAWIYRIAHNLLANQLRYHSRHRTVSFDAMNENGERKIDPPDDWGAADGGSMASQIVEREELREAILALPEDQRTVFILRFVEGFELEQVVSMLDKSLASIKSLQYRAVSNLRRALSNDDEVTNSDPAQKKTAPQRRRGI